jgi:hypothetical protein
MAAAGGFAPASLGFGLGNKRVGELQGVLAKLPRGLGGREKRRALESTTRPQW